MAKSESNFNKQILSLTSDTILDLYEIDFSSLQADFEALADVEGINLGADSIYRFCPMVNSSNPIIFDGKSYQPLPMKMEGFEHQADGRLPRPKLTIANPEGLLSMIVHSNHDFANCKVTRKRTFARFLDDDNFQNRNLEGGKNPFGEADPNSRFEDDIYFVNRKVAENKFVLEFELVSALEMEGAEVPARIVLSGYCPWKYRCDVGCAYKGLPIENSDKVDFSKEFSVAEYNPEAYHLGVGDIPMWSHFGDAGTKVDPKGYVKGSIVKIIPKHEIDPAPMVFICRKDHSSAKDHHPLFDREFWYMDECDKSMDACIKRFGENNAYNKSTDGGLHFGGFPSTEKYAFDQ